MEKSYNIETNKKKDLKKNKLVKNTITEKSNDDKLSKKQAKKTDNDSQLVILDPIENWSNILNVIKDKSERVFGLLNDVKLKLKNNILTIDLGNQGNNFIENTLLNKIQLIEDSIYHVTNQKNKIDIIYNNTEDDKNNSEKKTSIIR